MSSNESPHISYREFAKRYHIEKIIGSGSQSIVYLISHQRNRRLYVLKVLIKDNPMEVELLSYLNSCQRISEFKVIYIWGKTALILPYVKGVSIAKVKVSRSKKIQYLLRLLEVIFVLHHLPRPILINDIHEENILVNKRLSLIDFGESRWLENKSEVFLDYDQWIKLYRKIFKEKESFRLRLFEHLICQRKKVFIFLVGILYYRLYFLLNLIFLFIVVCLFKEV